MVKFLFFFSFFIIFYSYIGYGLLIYLLVRIKRLFKRNAQRLTLNAERVTLNANAVNEKTANPAFRGAGHQPPTVNPQPPTPHFAGQAANRQPSTPHFAGQAANPAFRGAGRQPPTEFEPDVTLLVAAYNEADCIEQKLKNSLDLDYPAGKLKWIFVTDGSTDATAEIVGRHKNVMLLHHAERKGKVAAINRAMKFVETPYVIFSDANTLINQTAVREILKHYADPLVAAVAGEKKIISVGSDNAAGSGESIYWKYESVLKKLDSELYSVVGAAGELFSVKTTRFHTMDEDIIIEDFVQSLKICMDGYLVRYEPKAYSTESASVSIREEQKRKVRIAAGAFQAMIILKKLFNVYRYPLLSFQFISHRILRWTLGPVCLLICFFTNVLLVFNGHTGFYEIFLLAQIVFYTIAVAGWLFARRDVKIKAFYIPYYFFFMNLSMFLGFFRFISGKQPVAWDKSSRVVHD